MKNYFKTSKWLRWTAAGAFGLMLVFNIMISLDFEKGKFLPSLTLVELGNMAFAQDNESGNCYCEGVMQDCSLPCDYGNGQHGVCENCAFWNPYTLEYEKGFEIICWSAPGGLCNDSPCFPGEC